MTTKTIAIDKLVNWGEGKEINTRNGPRILHTASPTEEFWRCWKANKQMLKDAGVACGRDGGVWTIKWWRPLSEEAQAEIEERQEESRATDSDMNIPCPDGLRYFGYQRGGIAYAVKRFHAGRPGALIADEVGLGKTIQTIGVWNCLPELRVGLVVCPAHLRINWLREFNKWNVRQDTSTIILQGKPKPDIVKSLLRLISLDSKIRKYCSKKDVDISAPANMPSVLIELGYDSAFSRMFSSVSSPPKGRKPVNKRTIRRVDNNSPPLAFSDTNTALPINNSSNVSKISSTKRGKRNSSRSGSPRLDSFPTSFEELVKTAAINPEILGDSGDRLTALFAEYSFLIHSLGELSKFCHRDLLIIVNYDVIKQWRPIVDAIDIDLLVCDESHYLKNPDAGRTKAIYGKYDNKQRKWTQAPLACKFFLPLSGTPLVNRPKELWTLVRCLDSTDLGKSWWGFHKRYCALQQTRFGVDVDGASNKEELQRRMRETFMVRRLKSEVLKELPILQEQVIELPTNGAASALSTEEKMWSDQREYLTDLDERIRELEMLEDDAASAEMWGDELDALRRKRSKVLASIPFEDMAKVRHEVALAKVDRCITHLESLVEEAPVIVFGHHRDVIQLIADHFGALMIVGGMSKEAKQQAVDDFQAGKARMIIGNSAMQEGLTLTAASTVVHIEFDWTPGAMTQRNGRPHRIGQEADSVLAQYLVYEGSFDEYMVRQLVAKKDTQDAILDNRTTVDYGNVSAVVEVAVPDESKQERIQRAAEASITDEQVKYAHEGLRRLAGVCDGAHELDGCGFNSADTNFGKHLASLPELTKRQAIWAQKLCTKYRRQLGQTLVEAAGGKWK